jgi:hypothetical protein
LELVQEPRVLCSADFTSDPEIAVDIPLNGLSGVLWFGPLCLALPAVVDSTFASAQGGQEFLISKVLCPCPELRAFAGGVVDALIYPFNPSVDSWRMFLTHCEDNGIVMLVLLAV